MITITFTAEQLDFLKSIVNSEHLQVPLRQSEAAAAFYRLIMSAKPDDHDGQ